jgi:peroxiredoxin
MNKIQKTISFFVAIALMASLFSYKSLEHGYKIGDEATDFELKNIDGNMVSLGQMKYSSAKGFIVVFTCNHCPFAKKYEDRIIALSKKYETLGFPLVAINPNDVEQESEDSFENMQKRAKEKNYPFPYLIDETQVLTYTYGAAKTPHVYILKKENGKLKVAYIGAIDDNVQYADLVKEKHVEKAVDELIAGKPVTKAMTKAIGCTIKWKQ